MTDDTKPGMGLESPDVIGALVSHIASEPELPEATYQDIRISLCDDVLHWLKPYRPQSRSGGQRAFLALLPARYAWSSVESWRNGRTPLPKAVASALASVLEGRVQRGAVLAAELREAAARALEQPRGRHLVKPETGEDRRGHWRR